jgi:ubiquitin C
MKKSMVGSQFEIFVTTVVNRRFGTTISLLVEPLSTVEDAKAMVHNQMSIPPKDQRLIFAGRQMEEGRALAEYGVSAGSTLHLVQRRRPGDDGLLHLG